MSKFTDKAPKIMQDLMREFLCSKEDAAAVVGNLGHESAGFTKLQEMKPTVPGSLGGYGWAQWTGSRRRAFEAWCKQSNLKPSSDEANFGYLVHELRTTEKAMPAVKAANSLMAKVIAFERGFERAGIKHYDSRLNYAKDALAAYNAAFALPPPPDVPKPTPPTPLPPPAKPLPPTVAVPIAVGTVGIAAVFWDKISAFFHLFF